MDQQYRNDHNTSRYTTSNPAQPSFVRKYSLSKPSGCYYEEGPIHPVVGSPLLLLQPAGSMDSFDSHDDFMLFEEVDLLECVLDEHRLKLLHAQEHILHLRMDILQAMMTLKDGRQKAEQQTQKQQAEEQKHIVAQQQLVEALEQPSCPTKSRSTRSQESRQDSPPISPLRTSQQEQVEDSTRAQKRNIHSIGKMNAFWMASPTSRDFPPSPPTASRLFCYQRFSSSSSDTSSTTSMSTSTSTSSSASTSTSTTPTSSPRKSSFRRRRVSQQQDDIVSPRRVRFSLTLMGAALPCPVA